MKSEHSITITDDESLVERVKRKEPQAFHEFILTYQRLVAVMVSRIVFNREDREELCQEIFLKIYKNLDSFRGEAKISTWIGRIAYNTCITHLKKKKTPLFSDVAAEYQTLENISGDCPSPEAIMEKENLSRRLQSGIEKLDVRYRTVLTLFHLAEMNYADIGKVMDLPEGTVKSHLFRARRLLKERLLLPAGQEE
jgi:RNA polymerase sigma-70 factor (ECF subfamily)